MRNYFITGASSGIGKELCLQLVEQGHRVFAFARREERLRQLEQEIQNSKLFGFGVGNVNIEKDVHQAFNKAKEHFSTIDVFIANAGFGVSGSIESLSLEDYRRQFETNVFSVLQNIKCFQKELSENKGQIVLMGSANSYVAEPRKTPYCMSKFAIRALAEGLYWELKEQNIAVTLICPGLVESEIRKQDKLGHYQEEKIDPAPKKLIMNVDKAVAEMIRGIEKKKKEILITKHAKLAVFLVRHFPSIFSRILFRKSHSFSRPNEN